MGSWLLQTVIMGRNDGKGRVKSFSSILGQSGAQNGSLDLAICETPSLSPCNTIKEPPDSST